MINCIMFRHGETDWNVQNKIQGVSDIPLNKNGLKQAKMLAEKLKKIQIDKFYSSDLDRSLKTAEIVMKQLNIPFKKLIKSRKLREVNYGVVEGMDRFEMRKKFKAVFSGIIDNPNHPLRNDTAFDGGETKREAFNRLVSFLKEIDILANDSKTIAISSHANLMSFVPLFVLSQKVAFNNCDLLYFTFDAKDGTFSNIVFDISTGE